MGCCSWTWLDKSRESETSDEDDCVCLWLMGQAFWTPDDIAFLISVFVACASMGLVYPITEESIRSGSVSPSRWTATSLVSLTSYRSVCVICDSCSTGEEQAWCSHHPYLLLTCSYRFSSAWYFSASNTYEHEFGGTTPYRRCFARLGHSECSVVVRRAHQVPSTKPVGDFAWTWSMDRSSGNSRVVDESADNALIWSSSKNPMVRKEKTTTTKCTILSSRSSCLLLSYREMYSWISVNDRRWQGDRVTFFFFCLYSFGRRLMYKNEKNSVSMNNCTVLQVSSVAAFFPVSRVFCWLKKLNYDKDSVVDVVLTSKNQSENIVQHQPWIIDKTQQKGLGELHRLVVIRLRKKRIARLESPIYHPASHLQCTGNDNQDAIVVGWLNIHSWYRMADGLKC